MSEQQKNPHAQALGRLGGKSSSPAKRAALVENSKKGVEANRAKGFPNLKKALAARLARKAKLPPN